MSAFRASEKQRQNAFKIDSSYSSPAAKADGLYGKYTYPFCLPQECAVENLYSGIRPAILPYFSRHNIQWHDGQNGNPSNHLCDSQVCGVNFLFPFANQPEALADLLRPIFPTLRKMLPVEDGLFIAFEWIGAQNYLGERVPNNGRRTRGANFTSADAIVSFLRGDGRIQVCLIEWKYTESYSPTSHRFSCGGIDKTMIYQRLYDSDDCPLNKELIPCFADLFYEPFYQLMRQQFLASEMEKARELDADIVSLSTLSQRTTKNSSVSLRPACGSSKAACILSGAGWSATPTALSAQPSKISSAVSTLPAIRSFKIGGSI